MRGKGGILSLPYQSLLGPAACPATLDTLRVSSSTGAAELALRAQTRPRLFPFESCNAQLRRRVI